jgi:uncharacterized protein
MWERPLGAIGLSRKDRFAPRGRSYGSCTIQLFGKPQIDKPWVQPQNSESMSALLPDRIEVERAVATGRVYEGVLPLARLERLAGMLHDASGEVRYALRFDRTAMHHPMVTVEADTALPLLCQTTLERYEQPVSVRSRIGLIVREEQESGLPEGFEPALMEEGRVDPQALIEDELILMVPVVARKPGARLPDAEEPVVEAEERPNPFAALAALKKG